MWFALWSVLVVGSLTAGFFLVRDVWRKGRAFLTELERAADVVDRLEERAEALRGTFSAPAPVDLRDPAPARARLAEARTARAVRRGLRTERHGRVFRRWWSFVR